LKKTKNFIVCLYGYARRTASLTHVPVSGAELQTSTQFNWREVETRGEEVFWLEVPHPDEVTKSEVRFSVSMRSGISTDKELKGHFSNFMIRTNLTAEYHNEEYLHARIDVLKRIIINMTALSWLWHHVIW
jgi:hypothetical protein